MLQLQINNNENENFEKMLFDKIHFMDLCAIFHLCSVEIPPHFGLLKAERISIPTSANKYRGRPLSFGLHLPWFTGGSNTFDR